MARNGVFPRIFSQESPRGTPAFGLLFSSGLVTLLILLNYQKTTVNVFTFVSVGAKTVEIGRFKNRGAEGW
jgi:APA family basic amino acid/polyamine antiporter